MPRSSSPALRRVDSRPDPAQVKRVRDRLRRAEGQVRGVQRMLGDNRPCEDLVTQLLAARNALDQVIREVVSEEISVCVSTLPPEQARVAVSRAVALLMRT